VNFIQFIQVLLSCKIASALGLAKVFLGLSWGPLAHGVAPRSRSATSSKKTQGSFKLDPVDFSQDCPLSKYTSTDRV